MSRYPSSRLAVPAFAFTLLATSPAAAQVAVPSGSENVGYFAQFNGVTVVPQTNITTQDLSAPISLSSLYASALTNPFNQPSTSASVSTPAQTSGYDNSAVASGGLSYFIYISGPDHNVSVPISFSALISASAGGDDGTGGNGNEASVAQATFDLQEYSANPELVGNSFVADLLDRSIFAQTRFDSQPQGGSEAIADSVMVPTGYFLDVAINGFANAQDGGVALASADPYFSIDPAFLQNNPGYSLVFSPFVGNEPPVSSAVPEPSTWAMMLLGLGALGCIFSRKNGNTRLSQLA